MLINQFCNQNLNEMTLLYFQYNILDCIQLLYLLIIVSLSIIFNKIDMIKNINFSHL